jgi:hypothetical protein
MNDMCQINNLRVKNKPHKLTLFFLSPTTLIPFLSPSFSNIITIMVMGTKNQNQISPEKWDDGHQESRSNFTRKEGQKLY